MCMAKLFYNLVIWWSYIWPLYGRDITNRFGCVVVIVLRFGCVVVIDWRDILSYIYITKVFWSYDWQDVR